MPSQITRTILRLSRLGQTAPPPGGHVGFDPKEGSLYGSYRISKRLGSGGMGEVYLAQDTRLGRSVALKFLPLHLTTDEGVLRRFQQEARTASGLNHPNILTIYEVGQEGGEFFIANEYIEGATLRSAIKASRIDLADALEIAAQVASALTAAHAAGVVHRDLKPANIMIRNDGYVKVIDFGLAKLQGPALPSGFSREEPWTRPGTMIGTVDYMSPEQARGAEVDSRTDLWSLGVILYEMLGGRRPFDGPTDSHVVVGILESPVPPLETLAAVPAAVNAIIVRSLEKRPSQRYQSAQQLLADIRETKRSLGFSTHSSPSVHLRARPHRKMPRWAAPIASVFGVCVLALLFWTRSRWLPEQSWFEVSQVFPVTFDSKVQVATIAPDGSSLAYVTGDANRGSMRLKNLVTGSDIERIPLTEGRFEGLTFAPDSKTIYYVIKNRQAFGSLYRIAPGATRAERILDDVDGKVALSADGSQFAFLHIKEDALKEEEILVANTNDLGHQTSAVKQKNTQFSRNGISWSPNADLMADFIYNRKLYGSTVPVVCLFSARKYPEKTFSFRDWRAADSSVWLDEGRLLAVSVITQGASEDSSRVKQIRLSNGAAQDISRDFAGYQSLSATRDSKKIAAVKIDKRAAIWLADVGDPLRFHRITPEAERYESVAWLGPNRIIAPSNRSGSLNLWTMGLDGSDVKPVLDEPFVQRGSVLLPGANSVVFSSNRAGGGDDFHLWRLDINRRLAQQLTYGVDFDSDATCSPDGKRIVYTSWPATSETLLEIPSTGGQPRQLTPGRWNARKPVFSPNGKALACELRLNPDPNWKVAIVSAADGTAIREFSNIPLNANAQWTPDGRALSYVQTESGVSNIWIQPIDGSPAKPLSHFEENLIFSFAWSPDGTKIALVRGSYGKDAVIFARK